MGCETPKYGLPIQVGPWRKFHGQPDKLFVYIDLQDILDLNLRNTHPQQSVDI